MKNIIKNCWNRFLMWIAYKQCPTTNEINEIEKLALRLQGENVEETISNILEWQDRNFEYWYERADLLFLILITSLLLGYIIIAMLWPLLSLPLLIFFVIPVIIYFYISDTMNIINYFLFYAIIIIICGVMIYPQVVSKNILIFNLLNVPIIVCLIVLSGLSGIIIGNYVLAFFKYRHFLYKNTGQNNIKILCNLFLSTFNISLSIKDILKYKIAICRDYAKLTVTILLKLNIVPYFITTSNHVVGAVQINNEYYIIDQRLPIQKIEKWMTKQKGKIRIYKVLRKNNSNDNKEIQLKLIDYTKREFEQNNSINIVKLQSDIEKFFSFKVDTKDDIIQEFFINDASIFYDEVTHFSIVRLIKKRIEDEFCNNVNGISKIEIKQINQDLSVIVFQ